MLCDSAGISSSSVAIADDETPATSSSSVSEMDIKYLVQAIKEKLTVTKGKQGRVKLLSLY